MLISIASMTIKLTLAQPLTPEQSLFKGSLRPFIVEPQSASQPVIDAVLQVCGPRTIAGLISSPRHWSADEYVSEKDDSIFLFSTRQITEFNPTTMTMTVAPVETNCPEVVNLYNPLRVLLCAMILAKGGLPFHCSAVERNGEALLFFGPSGAGKSTIASLLVNEWHLLHDDFNLLMPNGSAWQVSSMPVLTDAIDLPYRQNFPKVRTLFLLKKGIFNRIGQLTLREKIVALTKSIYSIQAASWFADRTLENVQRVAESLPINRLTFKKDASIATDINHFIE